MTEKLRALASQLVEREDEIILKRGRAEVRVRGERVAELVALILDAAGNGGATRDEIAQLAAAPDRPAITDLVDHLCRRRFLVPVEEVDEPPDEETSLDVFYWHFGEQSKAVADRLNGARLAILGVNHISARLTASLAAVGADEIEVFDDPMLRNLSLFDEGGELLSDVWPANVKRPRRRDGWEDEIESGALDCLIATSDFGGLESLRAWNRVCVDHGCKFFPVVLQDLIGYVGPLVVPGRTACFECARARQNSNMSDPESERASEYVAHEGQAIAGFYPSMASILADLTSIELLKWFGLSQPLWRVATLIEVNLLAPELRTRRVLKIPRCTVCSTLNRQSSMNLMVASFLSAEQPVE